MLTYNTPLELVRSRSVETPVVCMRPDRLTRASRWFQDNFNGAAFYAVKANPSPWVIDGLYASGVRDFDVASTDEIALIAERCPGARMAYLHPVKSRESIRRAYFDYGVKIFALDHADELRKIVEETGRARDLTLVVRLAVSNEGALFSLAGKFGAPAHEAAALIRETRAHADELGVCFHVGSQCMQPGAFAAAMRETSRAIVAAGVTVDIVDVGGGFPSLYPGMTPPPLSDYTNAIHAAFDEMMVLENADLWCEPGRALVAEAESLLTRVELRKDRALYLNDGAYGCLFDAAHSRWPFPIRLLRGEEAGRGAPSEELADFRFFGPTCDSVDAMPGPFALPCDIGEGDVIEIGQIGAYGSALSTRFNGGGRFDYAVVADSPFPSLYEGAARSDSLPDNDFLKSGAQAGEVTP